MQRIQFYPSNALATILNAEATKSGVSVSQFVTDLLENYYEVSKTSLSITQLTTKVLDEVADYIQNSNGSIPFDLNTASATYRDIPMTNGKKPQAIRASIGRSFAAKLGTGKFTNVRKYLVNSKQILSSNNALMYEIVAINTQ